MRYGLENERFAARVGVLPEVFASPVVTVELPPGQEQRPDAVAAWLLAANLVVRMFRRVQLVAPDAALGPNPWGLTSLHEAVPILQQLCEGNVALGAPARTDIALGVGAPPGTGASRTTFVGFDGWSVTLDAAPSGARPGLLAALAAACHGASQVFLHAAAAAGAARGPVAPFRVGLLGMAPTMAPPTEVDLGETHLVGAGAVGCAFVYALGHVPRLAGRLHVIDGDHIDLLNLNRYVLMRRSDIGALKPDVAKQALASRGAVVTPFNDNFAAFAAQHGHHVELLLCPIDSEAGRRALAKSLPRIALNAATSDSLVTVSRHGFADGRACLHCLYLPRPGSASPEERLAADLGLDVGLVEEHLVANRPVEAWLVRRVEQHRGVPPGAFESWVGQHIQSFHQRAVCGAVAINAPGSGDVVTPLAFVSAAAGVLLAARFVLERAGACAATATNYTRLDLLGSPTDAFHEVRGQDITGRCICRDSEYVGVYHAKYPSAA
ncbi:MAG: ThiF family adenylyltransferase [Deltaproteobacteria bacterium]|nr:ThiF family adenylyltransferase [Deltaproteobacteria bacterium]